MDQSSWANQWSPALATLVQACCWDGSEIGWEVALVAPTEDTLLLFGVNGQPCAVEEINSSSSID